MNQQNNNQNGRVKSKFFNEELFNNASINDIGSSTSGQVISYSVGVHKPHSAPVPAEDINVLDSTQVINLVNSDMVDPNNGLFDASKFSSSMEGYSVFDNTQQNYSNNIEEVLNESKIDNNVSTNQVSEQFAQENPLFYGYNADPNIINQNSMMNNNQVGSDMGMQVPPAMDQSVMMQPQLMVEQTMMDQSQVVVQPMMEQSQMYAQPTMDQTQVVVQPMIDQSQVVAQPMMEQSQVFAQPMMEQSQMFAQPMAPTQDIEQPLVSQPVSGERDLNPIDFDANSGAIDNNLIANQPLSLMALSGEAMDESQKPKDVTENSKFFQSTPLEDNRLKTDEVLPVSVTPVVDVLAEPVRDLNTNELVMSYIGPKYKEISMSPFSFCAFFFGPLYFFFRKMYLVGLVLSVINFVVSLFILKSIWIYLGCYAIISILAGLIANTLMLSNAKNQVIKIAALNPTATQYDLVKICKSKGGTALALALVVMIGINLFTSVLFNVFGINEALTTQMMGLIGGNKILNSDPTAKVEDVIEYEYPSLFVAYEEDPNYYIYYEQEKDKETNELINKPACLVGISLVANHDTSKDLIKYMADVDKRYNRVSSYEATNGDVWDVYDYTANGSHTTYRARKINGHIVLITYSAITSSTPGVCDAYLEQIMTSIKEK